MLAALEKKGTVHTFSKRIYLLFRITNRSINNDIHESNQPHSNPIQTSDIHKYRQKKMFVIRHVFQTGEHQHLNVFEFDWCICHSVHCLSNYTMNFTCIR